MLKIATVPLFRGIANTGWSSGCEMVASATAYIASILGSAASSLVGRPRVPATRTDVYAVFVNYHEYNNRTACPIRLSKGRFPPAPQNLGFPTR